MAADQAAQGRADAEKRIAAAEKALEEQRQQSEAREKALLEAKRKEMAEAEAAQTKEREQLKKKLEELQSFSATLGGARYSMGAYCGDMAHATPRYMCADFDVDCVPRSRLSSSVRSRGGPGYTPSGQEIHVGPRGGHYVYTRTGNKRYLR